MLDRPAPLSAEEGIEQEDTSFLYGPEPDKDDVAGMNAQDIGEIFDSSADGLAQQQRLFGPDENDDPNDSMDVGVDTDPSGDIGIAIMGVLQTLGVDATASNRFACSVIEKSQRAYANPDFVELFGVGMLSRWPARSATSMFRGACRV